MFYFKEKPSSALFIASYRGYQDIAKMLILHGANLNNVDDYGETPLHKASVKGHLDLVELLIANGAKIDAKAQDGCTPLYLSACGKHEAVSRFLLNCGAAVEPDIALMLGNIQLIKRYLDEGVDPNSKLTKGYAKGESWLNTVVRLENISLIELLLNHGARVNEKTGTFRFSPLHIASIDNRGKVSQNICEILIAHGADINSKDKSGETPLHWAAKTGNQAIVELLINYGSDVNALNFSNQTPLFESARLHQAQVVNSLLSHGAEVNLIDKQGWTPLLRAFQKSNGDEIVEALIIHDADVNVQGSRGESPLHLAVAQNNKKLVELLLAYGAKVGSECDY
ncbi:MAG: hypothetical protein F6K45_20995 [Kamptonema sp. SIO1D9]|nr:hypothetical protein [Kamptonema sp. SIO1D9]